MSLPEVNYQGLTYMLDDDRCSAPDDRSLGSGACIRGFDAWLPKPLHASRGLSPALPLRSGLVITVNLLPTDRLSPAGLVETWIDQGAQ